MKSKEYKKMAQQKKDEAWEQFTKAFQNADLSKFAVQVVAYSKTKVEATVYFKAGDSLQQSVFGSDREFWSEEMKKALGVSTGFPMQLTPVKVKSSLPIPAVGFHEAAQSLEKIFNNNVKIYVGPDQYFTTKFREIFQKTRLTHHSGKESKQWLARPEMSYRPQQLNFAVWCATTACGISREIFDKDHSALGLPPYVYSFYLFHVYFTIRRILFQMGGIQSISALQGDPTFSQYNNNYDRVHTKEFVQSLG